MHQERIWNWNLLKQIKTMGHNVNYIISIDDCLKSQFSKFGELSSICFYTPITYLGGKQHQVSGRFIGKKNLTMQFLLQNHSPQKQTCFRFIYSAPWELVIGDLENLQKAF